MARRVTLAQEDEILRCAQDDKGRSSLACDSLEPEEDEILRGVYPE